MAIQTQLICVLIVNVNIIDTKCYYRFAAEAILLNKHLIDLLAMGIIDIYSDFGNQHIIICVKLWKYAYVNETGISKILFYIKRITIVRIH